MITKMELDEITEQGCDTPGCTHDHSVIFLHPRCHQSGRIEVSYRNGSGVLRIGCRECGKVVTMVKVAG